MARSIHEHWNLAQGIYKDHPILLRMNVGAQQFRKSKGFPVRIGIAVPFRKPDSDGFPSNADTTALDQIEDELCDRLEKGNLGVLVLVVTTRGMREFVVYARDEGSEMSLTRELRRLCPSYDIQSYWEGDPAWSTYEVFHAMCDPKGGGPA